MNPVLSKPILNHLEYSRLAKCSMPKERPTIANTNKTKPLKSNALTVGSVALGMALKVTRIPKIPIGILIRNTQCHVATSTSQPPSVGPMSGPISPARLIKLIAAKNWVRGISFSMASRPTGSNNAPPTP